jgi:dephospho-CoA kinase
MIIIMIIIINEYIITIGHECYLPNTDCYHKLIEAFGRDIVDNNNNNNNNNEIDRKKLGSIVFSDKDKMILLQSIVWPEIRKKLIEKMEMIDNSDKKIIVEAAIMIEANWYDLFDVVVLLTTSEDVAIDRLIKRNNLTKDQAVQRLNSQLTVNQRKEKIKDVTNVIIDNNQDLDYLKNHNDAFNSFIQKYFV